MRMAHQEGACSLPGEGSCTDFMLSEQISAYADKLYPEGKQAAVAHHHAAFQISFHQSIN